MCARSVSVTLACNVCGQSFTRKAWEAATAKYCSTACRKVGVAKGQVRPIADRFWAKVDKGSPTSCWPWVGGTARGYGQLGIGSDKWVRAHRLSYELHHGAIAPGLVVRHKCDNKLCVNPDHLELGSQGDNVRDTYDRSDREGFRSVVPEATVLSIIADSGLQKDIAARHGVSRSYVGFLRSGKRRRRVVSAATRTSLG